MDLRGVRSLKTKWVENTSPEVMNSVFPKANFFLGHPVEKFEDDDVYSVKFSQENQTKPFVVNKPFSSEVSKINLKVQGVPK